MDELTVFVVNFNTTDMTNACVKRIIEHCSSYDFHIEVLDNSTTDKFVPDVNDNRVRVIDNTRNQVIDYDVFVKNNCRGNDKGNYASAKHSFAIDWMIKTCTTKNLLILDSDAFLTRDVDFIDENVCIVCEIGKAFYNRIDLKRVFPVIAFINVELFRQNSLKFFDPHRFRYGLDPRYVDWDTGTALLSDIMQKRLPIREIKTKDYVHHYWGASWRQIPNGKECMLQRIKEFMEQNKIA